MIPPNCKTYSNVEQHVRVMDKTGKTIQEKDVDPNSNLALTQGADIVIESEKGVQLETRQSCGRDLMITKDNKLKVLSDLPAEVKE